MKLDTPPPGSARSARLVQTGLGLVLSFAVAIVACSKEEKKETPAAATGTPATKASTAAATPEAKKNEKKKLPPKTAAKGTPSHGKKGGDDAKQTPSDKSHKAPAATTSSEKKHKVEAADHPCEHAPDGAAECHGSELVFCAGKELWSLDCNGLMTAVHPELFDAGTCYETDTVTDCLGVGIGEDMSTVACTSDLGLCCADDGSCYVAH